MKKGLSKWRDTNFSWLRKKYPSVPLKKPWENLFNGQVVIYHIKHTKHLKVQLLKYYGTSFEVRSQI